MSADALARSLGDTLLAASLQGAVFALAAWIVCRASGRIRPSVQAWVWWLVCGRLLVALSPFPAVPLPILSAEQFPAPDAAIARAAGPVAAVGDAASVPAPAAHPVAPPAFSWAVTLLSLWAIAVAVHAACLGAAYVRTRRIVRGSAPASAASTTAAGEIAARMRLRRVPDVRCSPEVTSPQTLGILRPLVLLPAAAEAAWSAPERAMVLAHELTHIRRGDVALGWIPAVAERVFFFHPLARVAAREYLIAREAACDAGAIVALGVEPEQYGELLVAVGVRRPATAFAAATAAWSSSSLRRRLEMLQYSSPRRMSSGTRWSLAIAACVCLMPFHLVARSAGDPGSVGDGRNLGEAGLHAREEFSATVLPPSTIEAPADRRSPGAGAKARERGIAAIQAGDVPQGNADAPAVDRAVAEMAAALERMSRELDGVRAGDRDARSRLELQRMLDALEAESRQQAGAAREADIQRMLEEVGRLRARGLAETHPDVVRLMTEAEALQRSARYQQEIQESLRQLQAETARRTAEEQIAEARRAADAELSDRAATLAAAQETLYREIERLRAAQDELRAQQRILRDELERLRAETGK